MPTLRRAKIVYSTRVLIRNAFLELIEAVTNTQMKFTMSASFSTNPKLAGIAQSYPELARITQSLIKYCMRENTCYSFDKTRTLMWQRWKILKQSTISTTAL